VDFPDLSALPPWAIAAFVIALAVIVAVDRFGVRKGNTSAVAPAGAAQVAAVIVDPTALNHATAAVEGLTMALSESNAIARHHSAATDRLAKSVEDMGEATDRLRDEVIRSAAKMK
jgi:hypothetical protein